MTLQWVPENYKPRIIMADGPYLMLLFIGLNSVLKYFFIDKYVTKERAKIIAEIKRSPHAG